MILFQKVLDNFSEYTKNAKNKGYRWDVVAYAYNPGTQEAEKGRYLWVKSQAGLHTELQDSQGPIVTLFQT